MPGFLERLHTLWAALRLRLRGGAPGLFYIGGSDTMPAPLDRAAEQQAIRALAAGSEEAASCSSSTTCGWWCTSRAGLKTRASTSRT